MTRPELSVVLVTPEHGATLRRTIDHLREQTVRDRVELVLVGPREQAFDDLEPSLLQGFASFRLLGVGPIDEPERALALGFEATTAPLVALLENHVYPEPGWAEAVMAAHAGPWAAVATIIENANPATVASWVEHFLSYGFYDDTATGGEVTRIPRNNTTYKRAALERFGGGLADALARDGNLLGALRAEGGRFYLDDTTRLYHLNVSRLAPNLRLRLLSARAAAARRARSEGWPGSRRALYVLVSPAFPFLRLRVLWPRLSRHPCRPPLWRMGPFLGAMLVIDAAGQAVGFAAGPGDAAARSAPYDLERESYLCEADRARFGA